MEFILNGRTLKYDCEKIYIKLINNWKGLKNGDWKEINFNKSVNGYIKIHIGENTYQYHRVIAFLFLGLNIYDTSKEVDHINHIRDDNRIENLRIVNRVQNQWNRSNDKGYHKKNNKYITRITVNKKRIYIGSYDIEDDARQAYLDAKQKYHLID